MTSVQRFVCETVQLYKYWLHVQMTTQFIRYFSFFTYFFSLNKFCLIIAPNRHTVPFLNKPSVLRWNYSHVSSLSWCDFIFYPFIIKNMEVFINELLLTENLRRNLKKGKYKMLPLCVKTHLNSRFFTLTETRQDFPAHIFMLTTFLGVRYQVKMIVSAALVQNGSDFRADVQRKLLGLFLCKHYQSAECSGVCFQVCLVMITCWMKTKMPQHQEKRKPCRRKKIVKVQPFKVLHLITVVRHKHTQLQNNKHFRFNECSKENNVS